MKLNDLTIKENPKVDFLLTLTDEQKFIYQYGLFNCKILKFKSANEVIDIMYEYDSIDKDSMDFIFQNSHKEVLCYLCHSFEDRPDIFVYGNDNVAFQVECFV
jgi:hypothetical protein